MKTPSVFFPAFFFSLSLFLYLCLALFFFRLFTLTECDVLFDVVITVLLSLCHFAVIWNIRVVVSDAVYFVTSEHWRIFLLVCFFLLIRCQSANVSDLSADYFQMNKVIADQRIVQNTTIFQIMCMRTHHFSISLLILYCFPWQSLCQLECRNSFQIT